MNVKVLVRGILVFDIERILNLFVVAIGCHYVMNESYTIHTYVYLVTIISRNICCLCSRGKNTKGEFPSRPLAHHILV